MIRQFPRLFIWTVGILHLAALLHGCSKPERKPDPAWEAKRRETVEWYQSTWKSLPKTSMWEVSRGRNDFWIAIDKPELRDGRLLFRTASGAHDIDATAVDITEVSARTYKGQPQRWEDFIHENNAIWELRFEPKESDD